MNFVRFNRRNSYLSSQSFQSERVIRDMEVDKFNISIILPARPKQNMGYRGCIPL